MSSSDCYFYYDDALPPKQKVIHAMCLKCYAESTPRESVKVWRWTAKKGYGKKSVKCSMCGRIIHEYREGNAEDKNTPAL